MARGDGKDSQPAFLDQARNLQSAERDALSHLANAMRGGERSFLIITHYQRLLDYIKPDVVHVLAQGRIQKTGGPELALELEKNGYAGYYGEAA